MATSPAIFNLVIPISQLSPGQLNQQSYGVNILTGLGILPTDATVMWTQINTFLGNFIRGSHSIRQQTSLPS